LRKIAVELDLDNIVKQKTMLELIDMAKTSAIKVIETSLTMTRHLAVVSGLTPEVPGCQERV